MSPTRLRAESNQTLNEDLGIALTHLSDLKPNPDLLFLLLHYTR